MFTLCRYQAGEKPYVTSSTDLSHYPSTGSTILPPQANVHNQEMLKFVRKSEIDNVRCMNDQVLIFIGIKIKLS